MSHAQSPKTSEPEEPAEVSQQSTTVIVDAGTKGERLTHGHTDKPGTRTEVTQVYADCGL